MNINLIDSGDIENQIKNEKQIKWNNKILCTAYTYIIWVFIAGGSLIYFNILDEKFINAMGPNTQSSSEQNDDQLSIEKWTMVAFYTFFNHYISTYAGNIVDPWIKNEIQNDTIIEVRFSYSKTMILIVFYQFAAWIDYILFLSISLSRLDMLLIGIFSDTLSKTYTTHIHLKHKK